MKCFCGHGWPWFGPCPDCALIEKERLGLFRKLRENEEVFWHVRRQLEQAMDNIIWRVRDE